MEVYWKEARIGTAVCRNCVMGLFASYGELAEKYELGEKAEVRIYVRVYVDLEYNHRHRRPELVANIRTLVDIEKFYDIFIDRLWVEARLKGDVGGNLQEFADEFEAKFKKTISRIIDAIYGALKRQYYATNDVGLLEGELGDLRIDWNVVEGIIRDVRRIVDSMRTIFEQVREDKEVKLVAVPLQLAQSIRALQKTEFAEVGGREEAESGNDKTVYLLVVPRLALALPLAVAVAEGRHLPEAEKLYRGVKAVYEVSRRFTKITSVHIDGVVRLGGGAIARQVTVEAAKGRRFTVMLGDRGYVVDYTDPAYPGTLEVKMPDESSLRRFLIGLFIREARRDNVYRRMETSVS